MEIRYDDDLLEAAVFLCASGAVPRVPPLQIARFHRERERLYAILDPDERNAAFFRLHLEWLREWGLEKALADALREFPILPDRLTLLAIRKSRTKTDEGVELYVNEAGRRSGVLAVRADMFADDAAFIAMLRHELMHLGDMVDPAFGYSPELVLIGAPQANERLVRERYRLLWDVTIDGRLHQRGLLRDETRERRWSEFDRAFAFWPEEKRRLTFDNLWLATTPRHDALLVLASDPRNLRATHEPLPGAPCPLCGFSTFEWARLSALAPQVTEAIRAEFPRWTPTDGACARCAEVYKAAGRLARSADPYLV